MMYNKRCWKHTGNQAMAPAQRITIVYQPAAITPLRLVLVGTTDPSTKLEIAGQIRTVNADGHGLYSESQATGNWGGVFVNNYGGTEREVDLAGSTYAAIFKNGNVGIGTASPADDLHVAGDVAIGTASEY